KKISIILSIFFIFTVNAGAQDLNKNRVLILCYHDIPKDVVLNDYSVDRNSFVQQIEYLRTHGYYFVSLEDIVKASKNQKELPEKAVLLTFDDAYLSFYEFVYPLLKLYNYPCVLSVVTNWIDNPPKALKEKLMNWDQIKEVSASGLVEIASHSCNLHRGVLYNPQGNDNWAATSRIFYPQKKTYETKEDFRKRIAQDLHLSKNILRQKTGKNIRTITWPYGRYNQIGTEEARKLGFYVMLCLEDELTRVDNLETLKRYVISHNPPITEFVKIARRNFSEISVSQRIVQIDLDLIYDPDPLQREKNLDKFVERIFKIKPATVYLQAFSDEDGDGNIKSVYFPNRVLPMKEDFFSRVCNQLAIRGIQVYAWMPMLSIVLPDEDQNNILRVKEFKNGKISLSSSWYKRLSPFEPEARKKLIELYEDLASNARIDGVVFQDDGYLNDFEDFSPGALKEYKKITNGEIIPYQKLNAEQKEKWMKLKTQTLIDLTKELKKAVLYYRPQARFARTLYAGVLLEPESEEWLSQNYQESLSTYDYVVIMAYPRMEKVSRPLKWLKTLVKKAKKYHRGIQKTIFKIQAYDWERKKWINADTLDKWLRALVSSGAKHIAYYPDNYIDNKPEEAIIRLMISVEDFPFKRKITIKDLEKNPTNI
ncbi:MAG: poly-beta-1,6-N-acetyl-D-glucosamine N-deacetylase PgaB, partial [Candidatus Omnitrophota bacterium]